MYAHIYIYICIIVLVKLYETTRPTSLQSSVESDPLNVIQQMKGEEVQQP